MEISEVVRKIVGSIEPYGDTNIDNERFENLVTHASLVTELIADMIETAKYRNRPEYSMSNLGEHAYEELQELVAWINEKLE